MTINKQDICTRNDSRNTADKSMNKSMKILLPIVAVGAVAFMTSGISRPVPSHDAPQPKADAGAPESSPSTVAKPRKGRVYESSIPEEIVGPAVPAIEYSSTADDKHGTGPARDTSKTDAESDTESARNPRDKMSDSVAALAAAGGHGLVDIVVRYDQHPEMFDDDVVADLGGVVVRSYQSLEMRAIRLPASALEDLAAEENVDWLSLDSAVASLSVASRLTANLPSDASTNIGYNGQDIGIAIIDTGVSKHADLGANFLQYSFLGGAYPTPGIVDGAIVTFNDTGRDDRFGHGTHVAGIITGNGLDSGGAYEGSAKGATVLALQVLDHKGAGQMSDVLAALDWLHEFGSYFDIRIVNLSLGMSIGESNATDPMVLAAERLWDAGIVVVVAAGNEGFQGNMTITSPGNSRKVITVGSLTDSGTGDVFSDDYVSSFSSRGPTVGDYVLKPDLVAPGNRLVAAIPKNSTLKQELSSRLITCSVSACDSDYLELSGTSMATPMVTAAVARMLQKDPAASPATVKARLMRSSRKIDDEPTAAGAGALDVEAALDDTGIVAGEALSPLMVRDETTGNIFIEDTGELWGDAVWGAGYLFFGGFGWVDGYAFSGDDTVTASSYLWTDGDVWAKGYLWTDGGDVWAKGYLWTDGDDVGAKSLLEGSDETGYALNDD